MINVRIQQEENKFSPSIKVIGVGGAGGNAVNNMISSGLDGVDFIVCNTDAQALRGSACEKIIQLGINATAGLGAGAKPEIGAAAAQESLEEVMKCLEGADMAFITAGMGGGTGTGAAPVIAKACRDSGILTVGVVTKPFHFEGTHRMKLAEAGIKEMQDYVDTLIVIPNQNLFRIANEKTTFAEAFKMADGVLQSGVRGVTSLMVEPGLINLDFSDIRSAMSEMGKAMMGTGEASGDKRAIEAAESAINNPLLDDVSMKGAKGVIINVTGSYNMTLFEADEACNRIREEVDPDANIMFGTTLDESMGDSMRVSIVATGIEKRESKSAGGSSENAPFQSTKNDTAVSGNASSQTKTYPVNRQYQAQAYNASVTKSVADEPQAEMFEQEVLSSEQSYNESKQYSPSGVVSSAHNTALRGYRHGGSFIPPSPATPESMASRGSAVQYNAQTQSSPATTTRPAVTTTVPSQNDIAAGDTSFHGYSQQRTASYSTEMGMSEQGDRQNMASGNSTMPSMPEQSMRQRPALELRPPVPGDRNMREQDHSRKSGPASLIERIIGGTYSNKKSTSENSSYDAGRNASSQNKPYQESLGLSEPARPAKPRDESDFDIPSFLKKQAN